MLKPIFHVALTDVTVWKLGIIFLLVAAGFYGYSFWAPLIIKSLTGLSHFEVGLVLGAISVVTIVGMLLNSYHSDHTRACLHRSPAVRDGGRPCRIRPAAPACLGHYRPRTCSTGTLRKLRPFWSMPTQFLTGPAAAAGIALVTMIANVGRFAGPTLIGI